MTSRPAPSNDRNAAMIPTQIQNWDLASTNLHRVAQQPYEAAVLPTAAIEPHNRHLPYGVDWFNSSLIARRCCELASTQTKKILCLPGIPYGVDANLMDFPLAMHVSQTTLDAMIRDLVVSLKAHGVRKTVILNGHGGNCFTPLIRQLQADLDVHLFVCDWWKVGADEYRRIFDQPDDHAGEMETSAALALYEPLVEMQHAGDGAVAPFRFEALQKGWAHTSRRFARLNDHCAVGDPSQASTDKGQRYLDLVCERISQFLVELAQAPVDGAFPHGP